MLRIARAAGPVLLSLLLVACGSLRETALPTDLPAAWPSAPPFDGDAPAPDLQGWWKALGDARLDTLVDRALAQNLTLAQARSRWRAARHFAAAQGARFRPALDAEVRTVQDAAAIDNYLHAGLDASWELGLFGRQAGADLNARADIGEATAGEQAARVSVVAEVVHQYVVLRSAQQAGATLQRMAAIDDRLLGLQELRERLRLGSVEQRQAVLMRRARTDAARAAPRQAAAAAGQAIAVLLAGTATDVIAFDVAADALARGGATRALDARDAARALSSVDAMRAVVPEDATDTALPTAPLAFRLQQVPADLLRFRPDVRRAEAEVGRATSELGLAKAALYPRVTLGLSYIYAYNLTQNRRNVNSDLPAFGLSIDIPLFDRGRRRAVADAREDALVAARLGYRQALIEAFGETEVALAGFANAREQAERLADSDRLIARQTALQATRERLGLGSEIDRLELERAALQSRADVAQALADCTDAFVRVYKALGGAPVEQVAAGEAGDPGAASTANQPPR